MDNGMVPLFEEATPEKPEKPQKKPGSAQVVLVQTLCCVALIGLFWLFRLFGGNAYASLRSAFQGALQNNALLATVAGLFHEETPDESYLLQGGTTAPTTDTNAVTTAGTTVGTTAGTTVGTTAGAAAGTTTGAAAATTPSTHG